MKRVLYPRPTAVISDLLDQLAYILQDYETIIEEAERDLQSHVRHLQALHERHADELIECLAEYGGQPEKPGSMMGVVHSTVANMRSLVGSLDETALDGILEGEKRLLESCSSAAGNVKWDQRMGVLLIEQRNALEAQINALETT